MKREFTDYIQDILEAINNISKFTENMDFPAFAGDTKTSYAVIRALEVIGEATKKIPASVQKQYPEIPWKDMAGMRDKLIHEYFGVILQIVWNTAKQDIPPLKPVFERILKNSPSDTTS